MQAHIQQETVACCQCYGIATEDYCLIICLKFFGAVATQTALHCETNVTASRCCWYSLSHNKSI